MIFLKLLEPLGTDFLVYFEAAKSILAGANLYQWNKFAGFPFNYPPTSLLFLWPLGLMPFTTAAVVWNILSLGAFLLSIYLVYRRVNLKLFILFLLFTVFYFPEKFNIGMGQINNFVLLFSVLGITSPFFLAFATGIKFAPAIFILYYILRKDRSKLKKYFFYLLILILVSFILVPFSYQKDYFLNVLPMSFTPAAKDWYYNQSLYGFLARSIDSELITKYAYYLLTLIIVLVTWLRARVLPKKNQLAAVACLYLLIHPIALQHYFGFAIIPLILLGLSPVTAFAYLLLAANLKQPDLVPVLFRSHQFFGSLVLWAVALKITRPVWIAAVLLAYVFSLINTGLAR